MLGGKPIQSIVVSPFLSMGEGGLEVLETILEGLPGAGDVYPLEVGAGGAEDVAAVEPEVGFMDDDVVEFFVAEAIGGEIEPEEVGAFGFDELDFGHVFGEESFCFLVVRLDVSQEFLEPFAAVFVGGLCGKESQGVWLAVAGCEDLGAEFPAQLVVFNEDVGNLQSGEVEGLGRRGAGDRACGDFRRQRGQYRMMEAGAHEFMVDLVGDDEDFVARADIGDVQQFLFCPDAASRIVGAAEQEELDVPVCDLLLEVGKVDFVVAVLQDERAVDEFAAILHDDLCEGIVDGLLQEYAVSRGCEAAYGRGQGKDDARRHDEGAGARCPA